MNSLGENLSACTTGMSMARLRRVHGAPAARINLGYNFWSTKDRVFKLVFKFGIWTPWVKVFQHAPQACSRRACGASTARLRRVINLSYNFWSTKDRVFKFGIWTPWVKVFQHAPQACSRRACGAWKKKQQRGRFFHFPACSCDGQTGGIYGTPSEYNACSTWTKLFLVTLGIFLSEKSLNKFCSHVNNVLSTHEK